MSKGLLVNRACFIDFLRKVDFRETLRTARVLSGAGRWILAPRGCDAALTRPFETFWTVIF